MNAASLVASLSIVGLLAGCATGYQPSGMNGGFSETQLDTNVFRVSFKGNGYTSRDKVEDFVLLRSADLTLSHGFTHFAIVDGKSYENKSYISMPTQSYTTGTATVSGHTAYGSAYTTTYGGQVIAVTAPSMVNTIVAFQGKPNIQAMVYDARFICESLGTKYEVTCGRGQK
ncbi:CC0125/CC1285 family lipoprotein [Paraburkholderia saeva]|jgi:hypothetical protein|uniref:Lipoprotein n=1 Tax=Paraburkholderia saeva TaxID=2777537 RepID=A0A9N8RY17_9BURK|nr:hypothetical protein [Paraburkholderia saeva]CAG4890749.1 hypothetical protein R52603_01002 [Paraburkholderia saeva]CAG4901331.1 hypothetical protein LMG31841_02980 [Paraburkholderia saeva]